MAKKTLIEVFGASANYNSTSALFAYKPVEINPSILTPITPQKIIVGICRRTQTIFSVENGDTNTDETVRVLYMGKTVELDTVTNLYYAKETWVIESRQADANTYLLNSY